jgi:hypothetical protein
MIARGYTTPGEILASLKTASLKTASLKTASLKTAYFGIEKVPVLSDVASALTAVGRTAFNWGLPLAIAAPPILGYVGGQLAANATDADDIDVDEVKRLELIDEYKRQTQKTTRSGQVRKLRAANAANESTGGRVLL